MAAVPFYRTCDEQHNAAETTTLVSARPPPCSYDRMLDTRGNTAVYLQFAHARLASILLKAQDEMHVNLAELKASPEKVSVEHEAERGLAFELLMFSDVIQVSSKMGSR